MIKIKFKGNLKRFSLLAPEEGGVGYINNALAVAGEDMEALAAVCEDPAKALAALKTAKAVGGKSEIPAGKNVCVLTIKVGSHKHEPQGVTFKKVVLDSRGGECQMRIVYQEPKTIDGCMFYVRNSGVDLEIACQPTQKTIQEEIDEKGKAKGKAGDGDDEE